MGRRARRPAVLSLSRQAGRAGRPVVPLVRLSVRSARQAVTLLRRPFRAGHERGSGAAAGQQLRSHRTAWLSLPGLKHSRARQCEVRGIALGDREGFVTGVNKADWKGTDSGQAGKAEQGGGGERQPEGGGPGKTRALRGVDARTERAGGREAEVLEQLGLVPPHEEVRVSLQQGVHHQRERERELDRVEAVPAPRRARGAPERQSGHARQASSLNVDSRGLTSRRRRGWWCRCRRGCLSSWRWWRCRAARRAGTPT